MGNKNDHCQDDIDSGVRDMRNAYSWYIKPSDEEIIKIWGNGILTVDANVLLDLYRYNETTREDLLKSLERFKGRIWISRQAAEEFIRNRYKAIFSVKESFEDATKEMSTLCSALDNAISKLKGNRIVPKNVTNELRDSIKKAVDDVKLQIDYAKQHHPDYTEKDIVFDRILILFDGVVGSKFDIKKYDDVTKEAQRRIDEQIPPGYLDRDKGGDRKYGDYFMWRQILDFSKHEKKPIIFVTSEAKPDWWEEHFGRTVGPRMELLREAMEYTGQRILIYKTERFVSYAAKTIGKEVDKEIVEDILAVRESRSRVAVDLIHQDIIEANDIVNRGILHLRLLRPVYNFTCSGHLDPNMILPPAVYVRLLESPEGMPKYKLGAGAGTNFDFNVHLKSTDFGFYLPNGDYKFEYSARCSSIENQSDEKTDCETE